MMNLPVRDISSDSFEKPILVEVMGGGTYLNLSNKALHNFIILCMFWLCYYSCTEIAGTSSDAICEYWDRSSPRRRGASLGRKWNCGWIDAIWGIIIHCFTFDVMLDNLARFGRTWVRRGSGLEVKPNLSLFCTMKCWLNIGSCQTLPMRICLSQRRKFHLTRYYGWYMFLTVSNLYLLSFRYFIGHFLFSEYCCCLESCQFFPWKLYPIACFLPSSRAAALVKMINIPYSKVLVLFHLLAF